MVWYKVPEANRPKLDPKARAGMFLSYLQDGNGYRVWDLHRKSVVKTRDVLFDDTVYPYSSPLKSPSNPILVELPWPISAPTPAIAHRPLTPDLPPLNIPLAPRFDRRLQASIHGPPPSLDHPPPPLPLPLLFLLHPLPLSHPLPNLIMHRNPAEGWPNLPQQTDQNPSCQSFLCLRLLSRRPSQSPNLAVLQESEANRTFLETGQNQRRQRMALTPRKPGGRCLNPPISTNGLKLQTRNYLLSWVWRPGAWYRVRKSKLKA